MKISSYMEKTYKYGIYATLIAILLMLGIPAVICTVYNIWPKPALVASVAGPLLALFVPTTLAEQLTMIPIAGTTCYLNSILGNVMNIKFPCYLNAINTVNHQPGTEEADVVGMVAITVSGMVTMLIVALGVVLLVPLKPILEKPGFITATNYILPALYGSMGITVFLGTSAGSFKAKNKPLVAVIDLILVFGYIYLIQSIAGKEGYAMLLMLIISMGIAYALYKAKIIQLEKKN